MRSTALGLVSSSVVIVPEIKKKLDDFVEPVQNLPPPSIMSYDLTQGAYAYSFTVQNLGTTIATIATLIFLFIAIRRAINADPPKSRKDDE